MLEACCRSPVTIQRDSKRAQIVLLAARRAQAPGRLPRKLGSSRGSSAFGGIAMPPMALKVCKTSRGPASRQIYTKATDSRFLKQLDKPPPAGFARLTGPLLAEALGAMYVQYVSLARLAQQGHCAMRGRKAIVRALERAQGYLKLPNGRALTGQSHNCDYKRHGTTTLFAALEVATGKIIATHSKRRRRVEFSTS